MFGFGETARLRRLRQDLAGANLRDVVEQHADPSLLEEPDLPFSMDVARQIATKVPRRGSSVDEFIARLRQACFELGLDDRALLIYAAREQYEGLKWRAMELRLSMMTRKTRGDSGRTSLWLDCSPHPSVLPIVFPPERGGKVEDFGISRSLRQEMADELFRTLRNPKQFRAMVNAFAADHLYFRDYPM